ncbi:MAG: DUF6421 family protein [Candidatus Paceibacterota bacterium]
MITSNATFSSSRAKFPRIIFDESRNSCWSIDLTTATSINPSQPSDSSYALAADAAADLGFIITANKDLITEDLLSTCDIFIIPHFSDPKWEKTKSGHLRYSDNEIQLIERWVAKGGSLLVLSEHEVDKYSVNINDLLNVFSIKVLHESVIDAHSNRNNVSSWVKMRSGDSVITNQTSDITFYRGGVVEGGTPILLYGDTSSAPHLSGASYKHFGDGKVLVFADSDLFGDDSINDGDNYVLWQSVIYWLGAVSFSRNLSEINVSNAWSNLKESVTRVQHLQNDDGEIIDNDSKNIASVEVDNIKLSLNELSNVFSHDKSYLSAVCADLDKWVASSFGKPDFLDSLQLFRPESDRVSQLEHIVLFNMYTQNGSKKKQLEAVYFKVVWPDWVEVIEKSGYDNKAFVPVKFIDYTEGYNTHSAVLFPETVSTRSLPDFHWGAIFHDREAARFRKVVSSAVDILRINTTSEIEFLLSNADVCEETFLLWDLIHDRTHSHGELPFDPFMIKQRMPYWLYALEELRCDLNAFADTYRIQDLKIPHASLVRLAVILDRVIRFPISGERVKNYDGLGGQILFAHLFAENVVSWVDNKLSFKWLEIGDSVLRLRENVNQLYRKGITKSKLDHWISSYDFVAVLVPPHAGSVWKDGSIDYLKPQKEIVDSVLPDEFPLSVFYDSLRKKLRDTIEDCKGITRNE